MKLRILRFPNPKNTFFFITSGQWFLFIYANFTSPESTTVHKQSTFLVFCFCVLGRYQLAAVQRNLDWKHEFKQIEKDKEYWNINVGRKTTPVSALDFL